MKSIEYRMPRLEEVVKSEIICSFSKKIENLVLLSNSATCPVNIGAIRVPLFKSVELKSWWQRQQEILAIHG